MGQNTPYRPRNVRSAAEGGRKRHIAVDVMGLLLTVLVTAASVQDRDAARPLLAPIVVGVPGRATENPAPKAPSGRA